MLYELPILKHIDAESVDEALFWLHPSGEKTKVISGGTDLLNLLKDRVNGPKLHLPEVLVNVKPVHEMNQITYHEETGLSIGSAVTLRHLQTSEVIKQNFNILQWHPGKWAQHRSGTWAPSEGISFKGRNACIFVILISPVSRRGVPNASL